VRQRQLETVRVAQACVPPGAPPRVGLGEELVQPQGAATLEEPTAPAWTHEAAALERNMALARLLKAAAV
jgi:hypothetical protein